MPLSYRKILFSLLALALLLALLETGTWLLLKRVAAFRPYPPFYSVLEERQPAILAVSYPVIDSLLGWSNPSPFEQYYSDAIPAHLRVDGSVVGPRDKQAGNNKKIVGLGGSTTDPFNEPKNWLWALVNECSAVGLRCHGLNGGNAGYTSTQELLKLERDVVPLRPDIVLSLNGINDESMSYLFGVSFTTPYHRELTNFLSHALRDARSPLYSPPSLSGPLPNTRFLFSLLAFTAGKGAATPAAVNLGTRDGFSRAARWEHNVRMMHAVAEEFGARYFVILQPHLGLSPEEMKKQQAALGVQHFFHEEWVKEFYTEARAACARLDYCLDVSREIPLRHELFKDFMHLLPEGHALEAKKIFSFLKKRGAL